MRVLSVSLLLAMLISLIGVGSIINLVYSQFKQTESSEQQFFDALILDYKSALDSGRITVAEIPSLLDASVLPASQLPLPEELMSAFKQGQSINLGSEKGIYIYSYLPKTDQVLSLRSPLAEAHGKWLDWIFTLTFYFIVALAIFVWLLPLIRSLTRLRQSALAFGQGDLTARVVTNRLSYVKDIERAFNVMAAKIERLLEDNRLLGRAVSHELKTPLARLRLGVDVVAESVDESHQKYIDRIDNDLDEMQALIDALLNYSRIESATLNIESEKQELVALCRQQIAAFSGFNVDFDFKSDASEYYFDTELSYLTLILTNLMSNAVNYGNGRVAITLSSTAQYLQLDIEDNGDGIAIDDREKVYTPFTRLQKDKTAGHGIGLAAVKRLCDLLGIDISIDDSSALGGAKFSLLIPLNSSSLI